ASLAPLLALAACGGDVSDPEAEIRAWVDTMQSHAEAKERRDIIDKVSAAYADARGNSRDDVENVLRVYFLRQNRIALMSRIDEIRIIDDTAAEVSLMVGMAGTQNSGLGISADAYNFELELEREGDDWVLVSARWGEIGSQLR
ncbi:MAG: hypothetical protein R3358_04160, partial [Woeseiaceae bacterium]|nr:hypothetical protein [Woeseiaceae bacterium]